MTYRHLYVPVSISWEAQLDKAHKIAAHDDNEKVVVHNHGYSEQCEDGGGCITIEGEGSITRKNELPESVES